MQKTFKKNLSQLKASDSAEVITPPNFYIREIFSKIKQSFF